MQYQVFKKDTREIVAWIDTDNNQEVVMHKDYDIVAGEELTAQKMEE